MSTRDLFWLVRAVGCGHDLGGTLLDGDYRSAHPVALAEHFHYPHTDGLLARYKQNLSAAVVGTRKLIVRREGSEHYDLGADPHEAAPLGGTVADFAAACRRDGASAAAIAAAVAHLRRSTAACAPLQTRLADRPRAPVHPTSDAALADAWLAHGSG